MVKTAWTSPDTYTVGQLLTAASMNKLSGDFTAGFSTGSKQFVAAVSAGNATESQWQGGWLECNGAAVSRTTYATLFNYLNALTTPLPYGGSGGTFNVPDYQGRMPVHHSVSGPAAVSTLGNNDGQTNANRRPQHRTSKSDPGHIHSLTTAGAGATLNVGNPIDHSQLPNTSVSTDSAATGITVGTGNANDALDAPSYLVGGIWVIKF